MNKRQRKKLKERDSTIFTTFNVNETGIIDAKLFYTRYNKIRKAYYLKNVVFDKSFNISYEDIRED